VLLSCLQTYWVVFAAFVLVESFTDLLWEFIPFYFCFKIAFLVYCMSPQYQGAYQLHEHVISHLFKPKTTRAQVEPVQVPGEPAAGAEKEE
jgi:receptor expression-enhancing protein 5/6